MEVKLQIQYELAMKVKEASEKDKRRNKTGDILNGKIYK